MHWRRKWQPTPVFLPGESQGWGAWWAAFYGVAQGRTQLKQLSSSSSSSPFPGAQFPTRFFPPVLPDYMEVGVFTNLILYEFCQFPVNFPWDFFPHIDEFFTYLWVWREQWAPDPLISPSWFLSFSNFIFNFFSMGTMQALNILI